MKKLLLLGLSILLVVSFVSCSKEDTKNNGEVVIKVGATPIPHVELLNLVKDDLKEKGVILEIIEFTDYVTPNIALSDGEIDANFFQHAPYLEAFSKEHNLDLISIGSIHVEPLGLYSTKYNKIEEFKNGALIAIPSDSVNGGRALILLENNGLIKLSENAGLKATENDIVENIHDYKFKAVESAQLARILEDVDGAIINGNYALEANLSPINDALLLEGSESPYANIIVTRNGNEKNEALLLLLEVLQSDKVREFIESEYAGGVSEAFGK